MKSGLAPLIIHHTSFLPYLPFCLFQNTRSNPDREVILLGCEKNKISGLSYRHINCENYQDSNKALIDIYKHASRTEFFDERRCLERWFILSDFVQKNGIQSFYYLDSDYLLFTDLKEWESQWQLGQVWGTPSFWGFSFFASQEPIVGFCDWVLRIYSEPDRFEALRMREARRGVGLGDMVLIMEFCREAGIKVSDINKKGIRKNSFLDDGFYGSAYYYHPERFQHLRQKKPGEAVFLRQKEIEHRVLGLHFVGHAKSQIPGFTGWSNEVAQAFFRPNYRRNLKFLLQYLLAGHRCRQQLARF